MNFRLWLWLIVTCSLLHLTVTRRLRKYDSRRGLQAEVQSEMVPYTDEKATLKCLTSPSATIKWILDGVSINDTDQRFTIERNKLFVHLNKEVPKDRTIKWSQNPFKSRVFQCEATLNDETVLSEPAKLIITFLDDFDHQPDQIINTVQGNIAVITCEPPKSMPSAITEYYFNQTLIRKSEDRYFILDSGNLQILDSRVSDSGLYRCIAFNAFLQERRNASWTIRLNVIPSPPWSDSEKAVDPIYSLIKDYRAKNNVYFVIKPANETKAVMGTNVTLECVAQGIKPPKVVWLRKRGSGDEFLNNKKKYHQVAGNLILITVDENDSGVYVCQAVIDDVYIESKAFVDVQMTPRFTKSLKNLVVNQGDEFILECQAKGNPKPRINWVFNGKSLNSPRLAYSNRLTGLSNLDSESKSIGISFADDYSKMTVKNAQASIHSGIYQCFASNELLANDLRSTYSPAHVKVLLPGEVLLMPDNHNNSAKPMVIWNNGHTNNQYDELAKISEGTRRHESKSMVPPSKPKVVRLSDDSVMVYWEISSKPSLPLSFFKIQYKEVARKTKWNTLSEEIHPYITSQVVENLSPDSTYRFRVMAVYVNSDFKASPVSDKFHLIRTSKLKKPKSPPTIKQVVPQSPTSIEVVWHPYRENATFIEGFFIHYRATSSAGEYFQITVPGSNRSSYNVSNLSPGTSYEFKLQCFNSAGVSDYSHILTSTTLNDPVSTTTEITYITKVMDKGSDSRIDGNNDMFLIIVAGIAVFALSVFVVCCIVQCASRYKQTPQSKKDGQLTHRVNGEIINGSLLHQTTKSSDEYKSETDIISSHPDKSSINNLTSSVSIDHFPIYHEDIKDKQHNYQTRAYMIDTYCDDSYRSRTGSWSRKTRKKCYETEAGLKLIATASSHNSLHRKYLYDNENNVSGALERRRSTFKSEEHLKCSLNARIHSKSSSFTKLDGTLERKKKRPAAVSTTATPSPQRPPPIPERQLNISGHRSLSSSRLNGSLEKRKKSRNEYVNHVNTSTNKNGNSKSNESKMNSYNGTMSHVNSKPPLLIMQSTC